MKRPIRLAIVVAALGLWNGATGEGSPPETPPGPVTATGCCPRATLSGCPDDYCPKPWPKTWCLPCGLPDDYCSKPAPRCIGPAHCNLPDDYCRKPYPKLCPPVSTTHYTCGGTAPVRPVLPAQGPAR
jgi:hypothetical protein